MNETTAEYVRSLPAYLKRLSEVAKQSDSQLVLAACQELVEYARTTGQVPDPAATKELLELLRGSQHFEALSVLADALVRMGRDELIVSRQYVQGLIDQGLLIAAREVVGDVIRRAAGDPNEDFGGARSHGSRQQTDLRRRPRHTERSGARGLIPGHHMLPRGL